VTLHYHVLFITRLEVVVVLAHLKSLQHDANAVHAFIGELLNFVNYHHTYVKVLLLGHRKTFATFCSRQNKIYTDIQPHYRIRHFYFK